MVNKVIPKKNKMVEIPALEYELLKETHEQLKRQVLLLRILEAEKNLRKGKIKEMTSDRFLKNIYQEKSRLP